jgi:ComEC/Rec2-related protein
MISMVICGQAFVRYINSLNLLAFSAFVLLLYDPFLLTDVGFQLSYLAVAGLVVFQPIVYEWLTFKNKLTDYLWTACSVSISAQVITFPLSAYYFHQFPLYFLLSNLLIIVPIMVIMYAGLLLLLVATDTLLIQRVRLYFGTQHPTDEQSACLYRAGPIRKHQQDMANTRRTFAAVPYYYRPVLFHVR